MSEVKVNKISPRSGTTVTLGDSGDTIAITSGASLTGFTSTGIDDNATSTAITIDSSENVLVSTADTTPSENNDASGISLRSNGQVNVSVDGGAGLDINRKTSDGQILRLRKDGTDVGSIGTYAGDLIIGTTDTGLRFDDGASAYIPWNTSTNLATNGTISLGFSTVKYNNLYLSGSVYLGGTGSANALSDYETGTWTPTPNVGTVVGTDCKYTKVGRKVFVQGRLDTFSDRTSAVAIYINDLPFAQSSTQTSTFSLMYRYIDTNTNFHTVVGFCPGGVSQITFYEVGDNQNWSQLFHNQLASANSRIYFSATYTTD